MIFYHFIKGRQLLRLPFTFRYAKPLLKGDNSDRKNLLSREQICSFKALRVDPFQMGKKNNLTKLPPLEVNLFPLLPHEI